MIDSDAVSAPANEPATERKPWHKPVAISEKVREITENGGGSGPDNACIS